MKDARFNAMALVYSAVILIDLVYVLPNLADRFRHYDYDAVAAFIVMLGACFIIIASLYFTRKAFYPVAATGCAVCNALFLFALIRDHWYANTIEEMLGFIIFAQVMFLAVIAARILFVDRQRKPSAPL